VSAKRLLPTIAFASLAALPLSAGAMVPFDVQVPLVLKALSYDRTLKARVGNAVRIAVLAPPKHGHGPSEDLMEAVANLPDRTLAGLPVTFRDITANDEASLDQALQADRWAAVYVMPGFREDQIAQIRKVTAARQVLAVAAQAEDVERGIAFGVGSNGGRPQFVVNLQSIKACGSEFDLALVRLSRVVQ
jgi:hypothetical protein